MNNLDLLFERLDNLGIKYHREKYTSALFEYACQRCEAEGKRPAERPIYVRNLMLAKLYVDLQNCEAVVNTFGKSFEIHCPSESEIVDMVAREIARERKGRR